MLQWLLRWVTYRNIKSGFLLDFFIKRFFYKLSFYFFYVFTIFFGDKYILENFFSNILNFAKFYALQLKCLNKQSFLNFFKTSLYIVFYILLLFFIVYFL